MFHTAKMKSEAPNHINALSSSALQAMLASFDTTVVLQEMNFRRILAQRGVLHLHLGTGDHLPGQIGEFGGFRWLDLTCFELCKYLRQFGAQFRCSVHGCTS